MNNINQTFKVETENGQIKEAQLLNIVNKDNNEYAIYSIDNGNDTSNLYASQIIVDENGKSKLIDITDNKEKADIIQIIKEMINK